MKVVGAELLLLLLVMEEMINSTSWVAVICYTCSTTNRASSLALTLRRSVEPFQDHCVCIRVGFANLPHKNSSFFPNNVS